MSTIAEIEAAIEKFFPPQVEELAAWLEAMRVRCATPAPPPLPVETWLQHARGAAMPGATTARIMALTRGKE
jgi:hypothetical protein